MGWRVPQKLLWGMEAGEALDKWVKDGLLPRELAGRLRDSLESYADPQKSSGAIRILVFVGSVLIGGGLLLFIASQWGEQSPTSRLLLLVAIYGVVVAAYKPSSKP